MSRSSARATLESLLGSLRLGRALRMVWEGSPRWTVVSLGLVVLRAALPLIALYLTKLVVDAIAAGAQGADIPFSHVFLLIGVTAAVGLLATWVGILAGLVSEALAHRVTDQVLAEIHQKSVAMDLRYYEDPDYHDSLHRAQQEAPHRPTAVLGDLLRVTQNGLTVFGVLGLLATIHWLLAVVICLAVLPTLWVRVRYADRFYEWRLKRAQLQRGSEYVSSLLLHPSPAKEVRLFALGEVLMGRFRDLRERLRVEKIGLSKTRSVGDVGAQTVAAVMVFGTFVFIGWQTFQGALSIGDLVLYFGAIQRGQSSMQALFAAFGSLYEHNLFLATLDDFMEVEPEIVAPIEPKAVPAPIRDGIVFEDVWFRYPGSSRTLLEGIDLKIGADEVVALVGSNGAGKTTIVKLLCRLYDPDAGRIAIDGIDLRELDPLELRREISVVFQDFFKYYLPARDNIWFGDVDRPRDDPGIIEAGRTAGADPFLSELPHGYENVLGRLFGEGEELSVGEWQKVALARAFFRRAQLLVVDEPTSALDAAAEAELFQALHDLVRDRPTLLISHRFSTVRMADRIYVVESGRILESGTHEELMERGGKYATLFRLQAAPYLDGSRVGKGED